jgi:ubiquinone/menaquinone biosynthesis C-methylase UbiE
LSGNDAKFAGSVPELYDKLLVPLIFTPYADDLAKRLSTIAPGKILELAAGTGAVTRALSAKLPRTKIVATDLNQPMLDQAAARQPPKTKVTFRQADAQQLPFGRRSFDSAVCQFGVMFFPDKPRAFREALRVLKPGGHFLFNVWDRIETNEFAHVVTEALRSVFPNDPPLFLARTPYGHHDARKLEGDLDAAGFKNVKNETVAARSKSNSARDVALALCHGTPLRNEIEARDASRLDEATDVATQAIEARFGKGPVDGKIQAIVFTATRAKSWLPFF